jgi:hypothetical protein
MRTALSVRHLFSEELSDPRHRQHISGENYFLTLKFSPGRSYLKLI